jgi:hypothetical protein
MPSTAGTLTCHDATTAGTASATLTLHDLDTTITLRDLIRHRVREEVARRGGAPTGSSWEAVADATLRSFQRNGFVVLAGDRQVVDLDSTIDTDQVSDVTFLKLIPLAGG